MSNNSRRKTKLARGDASRDARISRRVLATHARRDTILMLAHRSATLRDKRILMRVVRETERLVKDERWKGDRQLCDDAETLLTAQLFMTQLDERCQGMTEQAYIHAANLIGKQYNAWNS